LWRPAQLAALLLLLALPAAVAVAPPDACAARILELRSHLVVRRDAGVTVSETIEFLAGKDWPGDSVVRRFPSFTGRPGRRPVRVRVDILETRLDGQPLTFETRQESQGLSVEMETPDLTPGEHTLSLRYTTEGQITFHDNTAELYWNVTGFGWPVVIDKARAVLELPDWANVVRTDAYTGSKGALGDDFEIRRTVRGNPLYVTTRRLYPGDALTIVAGWPRGFVAEPAWSTRTLAAAKTMGPVFSGAAGLVLVLLYYLIVWQRVAGRPAQEWPRMRSSPPAGLSPAGCGRFTEADHVRMLAAALTQSAVRGELNLELDEAAEPALLPAARLGRRNGLVRIIARFAQSRALPVSGQASLILQALSIRVQRRLSLELPWARLRAHLGLLAPGVLISLAGLGLMATAAPDSRHAWLMTGLVLLWTPAALLLLGLAAIAWIGALRGRRRLAVALGYSLLGLAFVPGSVLGLWLYADIVSSRTALLAALICLVNALFVLLWRTPAFDRRIADRVRGFRRWLREGGGGWAASIPGPAESEEPTDVPQEDQVEESGPNKAGRFERLLPHAVALDASLPWAARFRSTPVAPPWVYPPPTSSEGLAVALEELLIPALRNALQEEDSL
jgi:hypothetical protein